MYPQMQPQASYGYGGSYIFKRTSNYIFYEVEELIQGDLRYLVQGFVNSLSLGSTAETSLRE